MDRGCWKRKFACGVVSGTNAVPWTKNNDGRYALNCVANGPEQVFTCRRPRGDECVQASTVPQCLSQLLVSNDIRLRSSAAGLC